MKIVSICLARINSKRLPKKLLKQFCGKPLIHYTAEIMNKLPYDSSIYTDSLKLRNYVNINFPQIAVRPKPIKYCQDKHLTNEELKYYNKDIKADIFIYLAGTSPIRDIENIKKHIDIFSNNLDKYDCAMGVRKLPDRFYWQKAELENTKAIGKNFNIYKRNFNNSETFKNILYEETGSIYIFKKELLDSNFFINEKCLFIQDNFCYDIDTEDDWKKAEKYYKELNNAKK